MNTGRVVGKKAGVIYHRIGKRSEAPWGDYQEYPSGGSEQLRARV